MISALRSLSGPSSVYALALEASLSTRQVLRILKRLTRRGRVVKLLHGDEIEFGKRTGEPTPVVYRLADERAPRPWHRRAA